MMAHPRYFMQAIYLTEYQGTGFMDLEESFVNPLKIVLCSPGEVDTDRRMCVKSSTKSMRTCLNTELRDLYIFSGPKRYHPHCID